MTVLFNNKNQVGPWGLFLTFLFILALGLLGGYYLMVDVRKQSLELASWGFFLLSGLLFYFGGFCYVDMDLSPQKIDIKFYKLFPLGRQYKRILIPVEKVNKIKLVKGLGPIGRKLVIRGAIKGQQALFPAVGLAACNVKQIKELTLFIDNFNKAN